MLTRVLLAVFIVLTLVCGGIAIYYNRVFEALQVALAETKAELAQTQARLNEQRSTLSGNQVGRASSHDSKIHK